MPAFVRTGLHRVAVLVRQGVLPLELGLTHQLFGQARSEGNPLYEVRTCALVPGQVPTDADFPIQVTHGIDALAEANTVIVPASHADDESVTEGRLSPALADAFSRILAGTRLASICTGAFVLAAAGLLDGRKATTHWMSCARFRTLFPAVHLDPDVLYTDEGTVLTSAGEAAGIDLCLHIIRSDHGAAVSNDLARRTVVPPHREGGQAQYIRSPVPRRAQSSTATARAWALEHLDESLSVTDLAVRESMSARTFSRRFREEAGLTPAQWLRKQRIDRARALLEQSDLPIERIATNVGLGTAAALRQHFRTALGVSPSSYRSTFRGSPESVGR